MNYLVVLFKNKERKRIIKKFVTKERAEKFFDKLIDENDVIFEKQIENGFSCSYEIGLLEKNSTNFDKYYIKDNLGRNLLVDLDTDDYKILKISNYKIEELIYDLKTNKKINFGDFFKKYIPKDGMKLLSKLNNKLILQNDEQINLFSLKSESDAERFLENFSKSLLNKKRFDCIVVPDSSSAQKKYLYNLLDSKGIDKKILYKKSTTFFRG
jgi:hypothetical protein